MPTGSFPASRQALAVLCLVACACGGESGPAAPAGLGNAVPPDGGATGPCEPGRESLGSFPSLPLRAPPEAITTGEVPHFQLNPDTSPEVIAELFEQVFSLSLVEERPANVGAQGSTAIWLEDVVAITRPECVVSGREFAHIHPDGSLHSVLPHARIPQAAAGWVEIHPFAGVVTGFEAFVMIFAPRTLEEVDVVFDLILEGLNFVTG